MEFSHSPGFDWAFSLGRSQPVMEFAALSPMDWVDEAVATFRPWASAVRKGAGRILPVHPATPLLATTRLPGRVALTSNQSEVSVPAFLAIVPLLASALSGSRKTPPPRTPLKLARAVERRECRGGGGARPLSSDMTKTSQSVIAVGGLFSLGGERGRRAGCNE